MRITGIVAVAENGVIGREGDLPWHLPDDMKYFMNTTRGHHIISGRINYESIPLRFRPLKDRTNLVITRDRGYDAPGAVVLSSLEKALDHARAAGEVEVFIIGGGQVFREALEKDLMERLHITRVHAHVEGDVHFPELDAARWHIVQETHHPADERHAFPFTFRVLERLS
jgi:dihydrofolate reductase